MISLDIESSGLDFGKCGVWQIGALEVENPNNVFIEEAKIDDEDLVEEGALKVTGKTEKELRNGSKQSQKQLILNFIEWAKKCKEKIILGHNIGWDLSFLQNRCIKYGISDRFHEILGYKGLDTHTIAQIIHLQKQGNFLLKENGKSNMSLPNVVKYCGLKDTRIDLREGKVIKEGTPHNALEDAKLTAECYKRLMKK